MRTCILRQVNDNRIPHGKTVVLGCILAYVTLVSVISNIRFTHYGFTDFDLAIHAQSTWNITRGSLQSSILGIPFLGNHMVLILFLIAPLYALIPSPLLLLHLQTLVLALGSLGIFMLARRELSGKWAACLAIAYLAYPPLIYMNLYEFHPVAMASSFLVFMIYYYKAERFTWFTVFMILTLLCQENLALIIAGFGIYALLDRRRNRWAWTPMLFGTCYLIISTMVIMPRLNNNTVQFWQIYAHLGDSPAHIACNILLHPWKTLAVMTTPDKLSFLSALLGPLGFLSLLDPLTLIPVLPVIIQRLLSDRFTETKIIFHYQAEFIPFIFASAILGIKRVLSWKFRVARIMPAIILCIFPVLALFSSGLPARMKYFLSLQSEAPALDSARDSMLAKIEADAPVVATFRFLPKLAGREKLYALHHIYTGRHTLSTAPYPIPKDIRYVIIDTSDPLTFLGGGFYGPAQYKNLQALLAEGTWKVIVNMESTFVLERTALSPDSPPETVKLVDPGVMMNTNIIQTHPESLKLAGFNIGAHNKDNATQLTLYWIKSGNDPREYDIELAIVSDRILYKGRFAPGNRVWPTQSWQDPALTNKLVADEHWMSPGQPLPPSDKLQLHALVSPLN